MVKVPIEFAIVFVAFFLARNIRLVTDLIPHVQLPIQTISTGYLLNFALAGALLFVLLSAVSGLYRMRIYQSRIQELLDLILVSVYWFFIYIALLYLSIGFLYTVEIPRLIVLFSILIATLLIALERMISDIIQ